MLLESCDAGASDICPSPAVSHLPRCVAGAQEASISPGSNAATGCLPQVAPYCTSALASPSTSLPLPTTMASSLQQMAATITDRSKTLINNDLKKILKEEGASQTGNKAALQARVSGRRWLRCASSRPC